MNELKIVIVQIYNSEKYLGRCIESILKQTYKNIELVLVDDGSRDNSLCKCYEYANIDKRIKIIHKENEGVAIARNIGINNSEGKYITFVDADDWLEENAIENLYRDLKQNKVDIVRGNFVRENRDGIYGYGELFDFENCIMSQSDKLKRKNFIIQILNGKMLAYVWLLLIKKSILIDNNLYFKEKVSMMEDTIFYVELCKLNYKIYISNTLNYHYYDNLNSATKSIENIIKNIYCIIKVNQILFEILKKDNEKDEIVAMNTNHCNMIINLFFKLYSTKTKEKNNLKKELNKILKNKTFIEIINNVNFFNMPIHFKIQFLCLRYKKINLLLIYFKIRKFIGNKKKNNKLVFKD